MRSLAGPRPDQISVEPRVRLPRLLDLAGAGLFAGAGAWMLLARAVSGGSARPGMGLVLASGLALVAARSIGPYARLLMPGSIMLAAVIVAARSQAGLFSTTPLSGPLGYVNADGALYVQAAIAGLMLAFGAGPWLVRAVGAAGAAFFAVLPFIVHVFAAAWLVVILPIVVLVSAAAGPRAIRASAALLGVVFVATLGITIQQAAAYPPQLERSLFQRAVLRVVDGERLSFWHDAFEIMRRYPVTGVGPGRYADVSSNASRDPDDRWAHNEFLQQGAEGGVVGLVFLVLIFVWGFSRLLVTPAPDAITALGVASLAALGIHATFDYVMHFPAVSIMAAGLVGTGMSDRHQLDSGLGREGGRTP